MGRNNTPKEKKGTHGRPRKYSKGDLFYTENTNPLFSSSSSLATHIPKRTLKRIVNKKENYAEKEVADPDLGERRKVADIDSKEDHSFEGEKRKKIEVCSTTLMLSWNCRGLGNLRIVNALANVVNKEEPIIVFLVETKLKKD